MATTLTSLVAGIVLFFAGSDTAFVAPLTPVWSKPLGKDVRLVGVEEYGRCILFAEHGAIRVVLPTGETAWSWPYSKVSRYINPREVAVSHECDAIAFVGDASQKYAWIVSRDRDAVAIALDATPTEAVFDGTGQMVAIGSYAGTLQLYNRDGQLQWTRATNVPLVRGLKFTDDNQRVLFTGWGGAGVVSTAGHVEWSRPASHMVASGDLNTFIISPEPAQDALSGFAVTDGQLKTLWLRDESLGALVSASGTRILASASGVQLLSRDGAVLAGFPDYETAVALSDDGGRLWVGLDDLRFLNCLNDSGQVLATIETDSLRDIRVSRDFRQVLVVRQRDLRSIAVDRYEIPAPCGR